MLSPSSSLQLFELAVLSVSLFGGAYEINIQFGQMTE